MEHKTFVKLHKISIDKYTRINILLYTYSYILNNNYRCHMKEREKLNTREHTWESEKSTKISECKWAISQAIQSEKIENNEPKLNINKLKIERGEVVFFEIKEAKEIWWKLAFKARISLDEFNWEWLVIRWDEVLGETKEYYNIEDAWWKPTFVATNKKWEDFVMWWNKVLWEVFSYNFSLGVIWWMPLFEKKKNREMVVVRWDEELWIFRNISSGVWWIHEFNEIWWEPVFIWEKLDWEWVVMRWNKELWSVSEFEDIKEVWWKPAFVAKDKEWKKFVIRGEKQYSDKFDEIQWIADVWWEPAFLAEIDWEWVTIHKWKCLWKLWRRPNWSKQEIIDAWWEATFIVQNEKWKEFVMWWDNPCWDEFDKVENLSEAWWEPIYVWIVNDWTKGKQIYWRYLSWKPVCTPKELQEMRKKDRKILRRHWNKDKELSELTQFNDIEYLKEVWWKPVFFAKKLSWEWVVMRGDEELCKNNKFEDISKNLLDYEYRKYRLIKEIWWEPVFSVKGKKWDIVMQWRKVLWEFSKIEGLWDSDKMSDLLIEFLWKPIFKWYNSDWKCVVMLWDKKLWNIDRWNKIQKIWWKPAFIAQNEKWKEFVIRWEKQYSKEFRRIISLTEMWEKPLFIAENDNGEEFVIWGEENLWRIVAWHSIKKISWMPAFLSYRHWKYVVKRWKKILWEYNTEEEVEDDFGSVYKRPIERRGKRAFQVNNNSDYSNIEFVEFQTWWMSVYIGIGHWLYVVH